MGRGLDLPAVNLVINFDLPTTIVQYIHRIGRTGRAERKGHAITYFTQSDFKYVRPIASVIRQAGFSVPEYTLSLNPIARKEKKAIYRHAIKRKNIAAPRKRTAKKSSNEKTQRKRRKST
ncbi:unnamed protein product, partial [Mesorhabditis belari]|uniref:Helicase C-terminal domain-containing protein n=1 Tax=Mesorhabditis belari TaxID=2138241 RepID=A0AAF3J902_9BILA